MKTRVGLNCLLPLVVVLLVACGNGLFTEKHTLSLAVTPQGAGDITCSPELEDYKDGQTVTLTAVPTVDYQFVRWVGSVTGTDNPVTLEMTGNRSVTAEFMESLSSREEEMVGTWRRFHGYDDSYKYLILHDDRTACYFTVTDGGDREDQFCYAKWELDEDNPIEEHVYRIIFTYSGGRTYDDDEFHYLTNTIWRGGYDSLQMSPVDQSEWDCDC